MTTHIKIKIVIFQPFVQKFYRLFKKIEMPKLFCYVYGFKIKIHLMFGLILPLIIVLYNVSIGNHIV